MTKLEIAKKVIEENFEDGRYGIFDSRNVVGDWMETIYNEDGLIIDICYNWSYFEVFGLDDKDFTELEKYYKILVKEDMEKRYLKED